jgi:hypothetical protein
VTGYTDYKCSTCRKRYRRFGEANFSCCVIHPKGSCCHAFEVRVSKHGIVKGTKQKPIDFSGMSQTIGPVCTCGYLISTPCLVHNVTITSTGYVS